MSDNVVKSELTELSRQMTLAANISDTCRLHMTSLYAAVLDSDVDEDRTTSERYRPCRLDDYRARVAAYSAAYWGRVDEAIRPALIAHRRYVDRVGSAPPAVDQNAGSGAHRATGVWFDFPRGLFNVSRRRLPWMRRRRRQRERRPSTFNDDYDETLVDFLMFLDVPDVDDAMTWKTRLRQRSVLVNK